MSEEDKQEFCQVTVWIIKHFVIIMCGDLEGYLVIVLNQITKTVTPNPPLSRQMNDMHDSNIHGEIKNLDCIKQMLVHNIHCSYNVNYTLISDINALQI